MHANGLGLQAKVDGILEDTCELVAILCTMIVPLYISANTAIVKQKRTYILAGKKQNGFQSFHLKLLSSDPQYTHGCHVIRSV